MPYSLSQLFSHGRGSPESREETVNKVVRRRSTSALLHQNHAQSQIDFPNYSPPARKFSNITPPAKKSNSRQRSFTIHDLSHKIKGNKYKQNDNTTVNNPTLNSDDKQKHRFKDFTRGLSSKKLRRFSNSHTFNPRNDVCQLSPLVTSERCRRLRQSPVTMTRQDSNGVPYKQLASSNCDVSDNRESRDDPASVEFLVRKCADCFDRDGNCSNEEFLRLLFLTHRWFMTSEQLMVLFSQLYEEETSTEGFGSRIFYAIRFWLHEYPHMFDLDLKLVRALEDIQDLSLNDQEVDRSLIDLSNKDSYKWMSEAHMSVRPTQLSRKRRKVSLVFNHLEPAEIAIHMSYLEYKSFRRLTLSDFHDYAVHGAVKDNLKLERVVFLFNNITHWVQCMILDHHKPQERANAIVKFVEVAKKLSAMRNFNTLMAIVGALTHTAISRMKKTMAAVPKETLKTLDEFIELLDSKSNYCGYRRAYNQVVGEFKIPVIGILMKDFIALHAALPDRVGDGLINVRKMIMISSTFQELVRLQRIGFPYEVNRDLLNTLRVSLYLYYNEEEIYQLSINREPRDTKHSTSGQTSSPSKMINMGFAEFASFTCQLGDDTIKQHVTAMVGSVFKTYDENSDGFISEIEFGNFIQNFPGLDSFSTVDKDKDGRISMAEMVDYFLKISSTRRNQVCQSFKHDFVETTYFHPTFCEECTRLLWGLVKQGWKCRGCSINCHKHCKDRIVQECRMKPSIRNNSTSQMSKKKQREKTSVSSESDFSVNGDLPRPPSNDDDTFDCSEIKSPPTIINRSVSTPVSEITSTKSNLHPKNNRQKKGMMSKTPPPIRRPSSPNLNPKTGRNSLQKWHNVIKKKIPSKLDVTMQSAGSQRTSFLHGKCLKEDNFDVRTSDGLKPITEANIGCERQETTIPQFSVATATDQATAERRDSGLSDCSYATFPLRSTSAPVTPLMNEQSGGVSNFSYSAVSSSAASMTLRQSSITFNGTDSETTNKCLLEENDRLRSENERLRQQLRKATDVIEKLQEKLSNSQLVTS